MKACVRWKKPLTEWFWKKSFGYSHVILYDTFSTIDKILAMPLENDKTISRELRQLSYEHIASFDDEATMGEALTYYENSNIDNAVVYRNKISGRVGNYFENFDVKIAIHDKEISSSCSCDSEQKVCMHVIALLYGWINDAQDFMNISTVLAEIQKMKKERLVDIVANMLQKQPHMADIFLARKKPDWDEIDPEPLV